MNENKGGVLSMAKPDDRSDNVEKLREIAQNTAANIDETEEYIAMYGDNMNEEQLQNLIAKNERRRQSLKGVREEIRDEYHDQN